MRKIFCGKTSPGLKPTKPCWKKFPKITLINPPRHLFKELEEQIGTNLWEKVREY